MYICMQMYYYQLVIAYMHTIKYYINRIQLPIDLIFEDDHNPEITLWLFNIAMENHHFW